MVGLTNQLRRIDDRLGLSSTASVARRLDDWPGARRQWEARTELERDRTVHAVLTGKAPHQYEDVPLWLASFDAGEGSRVLFIMGTLALLTVAAFGIAFGLDAHAASIFIGVGAATALGQAFDLRRLRNHRRRLLLTMLPTADRLRGDGA